MPSPIVVNGQVGLQSSRQMLAAAGKYFNVTNPTPGTAIVHALVTSFSATANGLFLVSNGNAVGGANIQLDRLTLKQTATAPTGTLVMNFEAFAESGIVAMTGAVATRTPVCIGASMPTLATVQSFAAGAGTVPAAVGTRKLLDIASIQTGVTVAHDVFELNFGSDSVAGGNGALTAARATGPARFSATMAPVTIPPQNSAWINMWWVTAAANTPSFEFSLSYAEL